jgi:hypothetical protein
VIFWAKASFLIFQWFRITAEEYLVERNQMQGGLIGYQIGISNPRTRLAVSAMRFDAGRGAVD